MYVMQEGPVILASDTQVIFLLQSSLQWQAIKITDTWHVRYQQSNSLAILCHVSLQNAATKFAYY